MRDTTEGVRREMVNEINDKEITRQQLEKEHGEVWDTAEMQRDFTVEAFAAPLVIVTRKADHLHGTLLFSHRPRFYFSFKEAA